MTTLEKLAQKSLEARPVERVVWRRKHGRGAWLKDEGRPVWTLIPVSAC